jgi:hypothetical protein
MPPEVAVWIGVLIVLLLIASGVTSALKQAEFEGKFPPISDDEFVALCSPGTSRRVALTVRRIVAEHLAVEYERVHPSMSFVEDIGAD